MSVLSNKIVPLDMGTTPAIALNNVVLPAPFGQIMARRWPAGTLRFTLLTARKDPNVTLTSLRVRIDSVTKNPLNQGEKDALVCFHKRQKKILKIKKL